MLTIDDFEYKNKYMREQEIPEIYKRIKENERVMRLLGFNKLLNLYFC